MSPQSSQSMQGNRQSRAGLSSEGCFVTSFRRLLTGSLLWSWRLCNSQPLSGAVRNVAPRYQCKRKTTNTMYGMIPVK